MRTATKEASPRAAKLMRGVALAPRAAALFVALGLAFESLRPFRPVLGPAVLVEYVLWMLATTTTVLAPVTLVGSLLFDRIARSPVFVARRDELAGGVARALGVGVVAWIPMLVFMRALMVRRRMPFDFPEELDDAMCLAISLGAAFMAAGASFLVAQVPIRSVPRRVIVGGLLTLLCAGVMNLACVSLPIVRAVSLVDATSYVALLLAVCATAALTRSVHEGEAWLGVALAISGLIATPMQTGTLRDAGFRYSVALATGLRLSAKLGDLDGDGYLAPWAQGTDCDDTRFDVNPLAPERAGNQVDEDCDGVDGVTKSPRLELRRTAARPDVWLLSVDALAADRMSVLGYARDTTPAISRWAARASVFEHAYAAANSTQFAVPALLSGRYPDALAEVLDNGDRAITVRHSLFTLLGALGYRSRCIVPVERSLPVAGCGEVKAVSTGPGSLASSSVSHTQLEMGVEWLRAPADAPRVLWTHLMDPHAQYIEHHGRHLPAGDRYDDEVAYVDELIGDAFERLEAAGRLEHTVIVLTADHGEQLDGGAVGHGPRVRRDIMHIPLIIWSPGAKPGRVHETVSAVDVLPTVLELLGARDRGDYLEGQSLVPALRGETLDPERVVYAETFDGLSKDIGAIDGKYLFVIDRAWGARRLFRMRHDPHEQHNLLELEPRRARALELALSHMRADR